MTVTSMPQSIPFPGFDPFGLALVLFRSQRPRRWYSEPYILTCHLLLGVLSPCWASLPAATATMVRRGILAAARLLQEVSKASRRLKRGL